MSKIGKLFRALGMIAKQPSLLNHVLDDNEAWKKRVLGNYGRMQGLPTADLTELVDLASLTVAPYSFLDGGSLPTDLALLKGLAKKFPACDYLEIGTWKGESVANVAETAAECVTIDLPEEELVALGKGEEYRSMYAHFSKTLKNVKHIRQNTKSFDFNTLGKKFDLIFVDGDHHYESVRRDTEKIFGLLKNDDSMIVWHDFAFNPEKVRWEVFAGILDGMPVTEHSKLCHVSNTLCCLYSKNGITASHPPHYKPARFFEVTITSKPNQ